jgi:membrane protease YdiL (CAAX protease family)
MSLPPPIPLDYSPPPRHGARIAGVWAVILVSMIAFIGLRAFQDERSKAAAAEETSIVQLEMAAKYLVGFHAATPAGVPVDLSSADQSMDKIAAQSPAMQLRAIMVAGEIHGGDMAQQKLGTFLRQQLSPAIQSDAESLLRLYRDSPAALSAADKDRLRQHYGWFGKLALSKGLPAVNPDRAEALGAATRTFACFITLFIAGGLASLAGVVLLIVAIVLLTTGKLQRAYRPASREAYGTILLEVFAIYLGGFALLSASFLVLSRTSHVHVPPWVGLLTLLVVALPLAWPRMRGLSWAQTGQALGLYAPRGVFREIGAGLAGYVAGMPILAVGFAITWVLTTVTKITPTHPIVSEAGGGFWSIVLLLLLAAVWAPITEELMFRGALFGHLRQRFGWCISALVVALIFASLHPQGWVAIPVLAAIAVVLAGIREWRGSIIGSIAAHALNNAIVVALLAVVVS